MQLCEDKQSAQGLEIHCRSGVGSRTVCSLSQELDVRHLVTITNWYLHEVDIDCKGSLPVNSGVVEFNCSILGEAVQSWEWQKRVTVIQASKNLFFVNPRSITLQHVGLTCRQSGSEVIRSIVACNSTGFTETKRMTLDIQVDVP
jgi:hypothetical protein